MGLVGNDQVVAPFANEAMRLLREDWKGKYGAKMLSEELFPILQTGIPQPDQNFQNFITVNAGDDGLFLSLIDKYGQPLYSIDQFNGLQKIETPGYPPPKLKPRIVWGPKSINAGASIGPSELDAVAVDPETGDEVAGVYVYDPPSGTTFALAGTATLYVKFTPTDGVKYRRAMGSTVLTIVGAELLVPVINWADPADIATGTALSGTQLNATASDPITSDPVPGTFTYDPPSGTVLSAGASQSLGCHFVPDNPGVYTEADGGVFINVGIRLIQTNNGGQSPGTSASFAVNTAVGNLVLVLVQITEANNAGVTISVSDTESDVFSQIASYARAPEKDEAFAPGSNPEMTVAMFWAVATMTTAHLTVTISSSETFAAQAAVFGGTHPTTPIRDAVTNTQAVTYDPVTLTTGSIAAVSGDAIVALFRSERSSTLGTGYSNLATLGQKHLNVSGAEAATRDAPFVDVDPGSIEKNYVAIGASIRQP